MYIIPRVALGVTERAVLELHKNTLNVTAGFHVLTINSCPILNPEFGCLILK